MVGFTSDVTRRKKVEEELRRSAAFLEQAQQLSRTGSFSWRVATDEITWSQQLYRIYELDPGLPVTLELIRTRVHPEDLTLYEKMVEQARNGSDDFEWQWRLLMPDQSIKDMYGVARATRDQNGDLEWELKTSLEPSQIIYSAGTLRIGQLGFLYQFSSDGFEKIDEWQWIVRARILPISVEKFQVNDFLPWVSYTAPNR